MIELYRVRVYKNCDDGHLRFKQIFKTVADGSPTFEPTNPDEFIDYFASQEEVDSAIRWALGQLEDADGCLVEKANITQEVTRKDIAH